jgi:hypothetical protein
MITYSNFTEFRNAVCIRFLVKHNLRLELSSKLFKTNIEKSPCGAAHRPGISSQLLLLGQRWLAALTKLAKKYILQRGCCEVVAATIVSELAYTLHTSYQVPFIPEGGFFGGGRLQLCWLQVAGCRQRCRYQGWMGHALGRATRRMCRCNFTCEATAT